MALTLAMSSLINSDGAAIKTWRLPGGPQSSPSVLPQNVNIRAVQDQVRAPCQCRTITLSVSRKPSNEAVYSFRPGLARSLSQWDVAETGAGLDSSPRHPSSSSWDLARPNTSSSGSSTFSSPAPYHARHIPNITVVIARCVMLMICICRTWQLGSTVTFIGCKITIIV